MSLLLARAAPAGGGGTLAATLDDVTTRTGVALPLLLTSGAYSNANATVSEGVSSAGTLSLTLDSVTVSATGAVRVSGSLSATLGAVALSATGTVSNGPTGTLAATLADVAVSAAGTVSGIGIPTTRPAGWYGARTPEQARREREAARRRLEEDEDESKTPGSLPAEAQAGPGSSAATQTAPAADLELTRQLVAYWSGEADRAQLNRRAQRALDYALRAQSVLALQLFERELARQMEDDEMASLLLLLAEDD
jgi:hypothetical protein